MRTLSATLFVITMLTPQTAHAQTRVWLFDDRSYIKPLAAAVRDAQVSAAIGFADKVDYLVKDTQHRLTWDIDLGSELPLVGVQSASFSGYRIPQGTHAIGLWFPIDFHMLEDLGSDDSNPIINTDYRFGIMLKYIYGVSDRTALGFRGHLGHESTHIGDEFAIAGQRTYPATFERINVSWEYVDALVTVNRELSSTMIGTVRAGVTTTIPFGDTYYSTDPGSVTESAIGPVTLSHNSVDPYAGLELEMEHVFGSMGILFSAESRWRSIYDYHKSSDDEPEERQLSTNVILGLRKSGGSTYGRFTPFLRYYRGVNPHGQFRNQKDFTLAAVGFRLVH